ncbi:MAG TPA: CHAT domain-containing protein, partial [Vicinamibacteria bacterium]|nr:CHAT domain-containing protein [Vicinamibacteria bacterium]
APLKREEVAAAAQRLGSHVVSYWVAEDATYVWVVAPGGALHSARIAAGAARLRALVAATAAAPDVLRQGGAPDPQPWRTLHRLLVEPIAPWLPRERGALLTLVPHGPLLRLAFAALRDARGRYLVERYALHSVPAVSALRFTARAPAAAPRYLLVGDPQGLPPAPGGRALPRLPGAAREVKSLRLLLEGRAVTVLTGAAAREAAVKDAVAAHTVVHLATHGVVRDDAPLSSFVALGAGEPGQDGRLTAAEVYGLRLDAPLVVLSACRTGRGPVTGDGILGLTRAFLSAGAGSLVATLWDVPDAPSAELVPAFYRALLRGEGRAAALRAAQLDLLARLRRGALKVAPDGAGAAALPEDPALWAGFTLLGEP